MPTNERVERAKRARAAGNQRTTPKAPAKTAPTAQPTTTPVAAPVFAAAAPSPNGEGEQSRARGTKRATAPVAPAKATQEKASARVPAKRSPTQPAAAKPDPKAFDLNTAVTNMQLDHVQCRDFGHSWRPYTARWLPTYNSYESQLVCTRCKTIRTRFLSRSGAQLDSAYDYADGYLIKGMGRLTGTDRDVIRLASILAVLENTE